MAKSVTTRVFFGVVMGAALVGLLVLDGWVDATTYPDRLERFWLPRGVIFFGLVVAFMLAGCVELHRLARAKGVELLLPVSALSIGVVVAQPLLGETPLCFYTTGGVTFLALLLAAFIYGLRQGSEKSLLTLSVTAFGILYLGMGGWFIMRIRLLGEPGQGLWGEMGSLLTFLAVVKSCDIGAYFTGRRFGRHKWVPEISPKKSWEGLAGGIGVAVITSSLFGLISGIMPFLVAVLFGVVMAISGQLGDLLESMLKRDTDSKDSGALVPEFGGVLDMLDSVLVSAPFAYMILRS